jgi:cytochrome c oxidase cbb3-type subunit IV
MDMDVNLIRNIVTLAAFAAYLGIVWWAYAPARKAKIERLGRLPFDEGE